MPYHESYEKLLYQHEVLRARLTIREHYLGTVVKEVYENIGQMLSLIRLQLSAFRYGFEADGKEKIASSGEMVGKTIHDLRSMCRLFYPEEDIINGSGFHRVVAAEIRSRFPEAEYLTDNEGVIPVILRGEKGMILFGTLLELFNTIREEQQGNLTRVEMKSSGNKLQFIISYTGEMIRRSRTKKQPGFFNLTIFDRAELLGGKLQIKTNGAGDRRIKLEVPIK